MIQDKPLTASVRVRGRPIDPRMAAAVEHMVRALEAHSDRHDTPRQFLLATLASMRERHRDRPVRKTEIAKRIRLVNDHERECGLAREVLDDVALVQRIEAIQRAHDDLWEAGYQLRNVDRLQVRHARVLLALWRERYVRRTVEQRWTALRWWAERCLVKPTVVPPLASLWPRPEDEPDDAQPAPADVSSDVASERASKGASEGATDTRDPQAAAANAAQDLDPAQVTAALEGFSERAAWMHRLKVALGLTTVEAARLDPRVATAYPGVLLTCVARGRTGRSVQLDRPDQRELVAQLRQWAEGQYRRGPLGWPDLTDRQTVNKFDHLLRKARQAVAGGEANRPETST